MQSILQEKGIIVNSTQAANFALYASRAVERQHKKLSPRQHRECLKLNVLSLFNEWKTISGPETALACYVGPIGATAKERTRLVKALIQHELVHVYLMSNEQASPTLVAGKGERVYRVPLSFPTQPTRADVNEALLKAVSAEGEDDE